jgi:hypothetical protein
LPDFDYGSNACYFITICTDKRIHFFGEVENQEMILNEIGNIVQEEWIKTPAIRPNMNLDLDAFVVMPNHFMQLFVLGKIDIILVTMILLVMEEMECIPFLPVIVLGLNRKTWDLLLGGFKSAVTIQARIIDSWH